MTAKKRALVNLAESLELPLADVEHAVFTLTEDEPSEEEINALAVEFDSYANPVLAKYIAQEPSSEHVSALKRYVQGGREILSSEVRTLLKTSAKLRDILHRMIQEIAAGPGSFALAPIAAASDGDLELFEGGIERRFEGGTVSVAPADGHPMQVYIVVRFDDPKSRARYAILRAEDDTDVAMLPLDEDFEGVGILQILVDLGDPEVERFVSLFRMPTSRGALSR